MEITGKLIKILPEVQGETARGPWIRGGFVIETGDDYPRKVAFTAFGEERIAMAKNIPMNAMVQVTFTPESREYNERWYTDLRCSRIQPFVAGQMPSAPAGNYTWQPSAQPMPQPAAAPQAAPQQPGTGFAQPPVMPGNSDDDLPF